jgi:hypothetical protein
MDQPSGNHEVELARLKELRSKDLGRLTIGECLELTWLLTVEEWVTNGREIGPMRRDIVQVFRKGECPD